MTNTDNILYENINKYYVYNTYTMYYIYININIQYMTNLNNWIVYNFTQKKIENYGREI